jgi:UDP-glucose 4-epimerase
MMVWSPDAGYIGSHMVQELVDPGERVVTLDDLSAGFYWAVGTTCCRALS